MYMKNRAKYQNNDFYVEEQEMCENTSEEKE